MDVYSKERVGLGIWCHQKKIYGPKVILFTKIKPEYSDILLNPTHFPGPLFCRIKQVPLYLLSGLGIYDSSQG
jgi:hypothetical protein